MQEPAFPVDSSLPPSSPLPPSARRRRRRKQRTVYSAQQRRELEQFFETKPYPTYAERETLAARLNLDEYRVQVWFKNRRAKGSRLQGQTRRQGQEAPAEPQGPRVCAPAPVAAPPPAPPPEPVSEPVPKTAPWPALVPLPGNPSILLHLLFPAHPVFPGGPVFSEGPGFCYPPPPNPWEGFPAAGPSLSRHSQACLHPAQGAQDLAQAAPAPAPALAPACPQGPCASSFSPDPVVSPGLTELLSLQDLLEGPNCSSSSGNQEGKDFVEENDWDLYQFMELYGVLSP